MASYLGDFYAIAVDLRGMGDSNRALDVKLYQKDEMGKDITAIADAMGVDQCYLAGHDWGGAIVQEMAFVIPTRIEKMIIINNATGHAKASEILVKQMYRSSWYQYS